MGYSEVQHFDTEAQNSRAVDSLAAPCVRLLPLIASVFLLLLTSAQTGHAKQSSEAKAIVTTHLLAISICPPWKEMPSGVCEQDITLLNKSARALNVAPKDVTLLLNEEATYAPIKAAFEAYNTLESDDRLVIYLNLHNGAKTAGSDASATNDVMVLYSKDDPEIIEFALAEKHWIEASELAGWVHQIPAGEVILIMDACESSAVDALFLENHPADDKARPEAVLTSAQPGQIANLTADLTHALFTHNLGQALISSAKEGKTLAHAAQNAAAQTKSQAVPICKAALANQLAAGVHESVCHQTPKLEDPHNLFSNIVLLAEE